MREKEVHLWWNVNGSETNNTEQYISEKATHHNSRILANNRCVAFMS